MSSTYKHEIRPSGEGYEQLAAVRRVPSYSQMIGRRAEVPESGERPTIITKMMLNYRQPPKQRDQRQQPKVAV